MFELFPPASDQKEIGKDINNKKKDTRPRPKIGLDRKPKAKSGTINKMGGYSN
tara:strand:+ start:112 stop:270 length:159 start_codon:yes stop_codon:yes gene_type:complete